MRRLRAHGPCLVAITVGIALGLHSQAAAGVDVLYGTNDVGRPGGPDELVQVDGNTGVARTVHVFSSEDFCSLGSLAYDAREYALWTTNDGVLIRIQPVTLDSRCVGPTGFDDIAGLAAHPSTGLLLGVTYAGNDLVRIDKTGGGTIVLNGHLEEGARLEDLAFEPGGRLYVLTSSALVEVDPSTGEPLSRVLLWGAEHLEALVWDGRRGAFLSAADRGGSKDLVTISRSTGEVSFVGPAPSGYGDIEALALVPRAPVVPLEVQALASRRDDHGALLVWEARREDLAFVVQRAMLPEGPWSEIGRVDAPASGRAGAWRFEHLDAEAATDALAGRPLHYRVGTEAAAGEWAWVRFDLAAAPRDFVLRPNFPNPFNPTTTFQVRLPAPAQVDLVLYDVHGRVVRRRRVDLAAGTHAVVWDGRDADGRAVAGGVYPYVLRAGGCELHGRAVLVK